MLRLLAFLSVLGLVASDPKFEETFDFPTCPINYFGTEYTKAYMRITVNNDFVVCLDNYGGSECIKGPKVDSPDIVGSIKVATPAMITEYDTGLPKVPFNLRCTVSFIATGNTDADITLAKMGPRAAMSAIVTDMAKHTFTLETGGDSFKVEVDSSTRGFKEIGRCLFGGNTYEPGVISGPDPITCGTKRCLEELTVVDLGRCDAMEHCDVDKNCVYDSPCTVSGPGVVDFKGQYISIEDLCDYTLLEGSGVTITGEFKDRRRKDLGLLDTVKIVNGARTITMFNDGRVVDGSTTLTFTETPMDFSGLMLSKDDAGITAAFSGSLSSSHSFVVFFTGNFVQISYSESGEAGASMTGLCADVTTLPDTRVNEPGCTKVPYEDADSTISCSAVETDCDILSTNTKIKCDDVEPEPYIKLCKEIMCKYPALDGFTCPFHEAYARACSLHGNEAGDWRKDISCDAPDLFCLDKTCVDDEFCGETAANTRSCICRAVNRPELYGGDTECDDATHKASVTLNGCLLEEKGFDIRSLHLMQSSCKGLVDDSSHTVTFSFDKTNLCGAEVTLDENNNKVFKNTVRNTDSSSLITTEDQVDVDFSCIFAEPDIKTGSFRIIENSVVLDFASAEWTYTLSMKAYSDDGLTTLVEDSTDLLLDQTIWMKLTTTGLNADIVTVVTDSCWATNEESSSALTRLDLIRDGCANPDEASVEVTGNGVGLSNSFSFKMFQFFGSSGNVFLHCQIELCHTNCVPICGSGGRRRRSNRMGYINEDPAIITMAWTQ